MELATARIERLTDLVGGAFAPVEMPPGKEGAPRLTYSAFYSGTFRLFQLDLADEDVAHARLAGERAPQTSPLAPSRRAVEREKLELLKQGLGEEEIEERMRDKLAAAADADADADLVPFAPPLELTLDAGSKQPYQRTWKLDRPTLGVGLTDNGVILANFALRWSDMLGDRQIFLAANSYDGFTDTTVGYLNMAGRMNWGAVLRDFRDYYVTNDPLGVADRLQRRQRFTSASAFASYPFSRYLRVDGSISYTQSRISYPQQSLFSPTVTFVRFSDDYPTLTVDLVGDTTRYQRFGPYQGHRFRLGVSRLEFISGDRDGQSINNFHLDYRAYKKVTRRSVLALWLYGILQDGERGNLYSMGGINQLRGFAFRDFVGENVALVNLEFRFPLIDALRWGFGGISGPIRGTLFVSAGSAWFEDELVLDFFDPTATPERTRAVFDRRIGGLRKFRSRVDGFLVDIHVSAGYAVTLNFLGLPLTWSYAKIWDGKEFGPKRTDFFITFDW
ncbi:MAG: BamA/TamA family outer membrane protein [Acidobacteriota bacterium]|nr:BamA/TamA family outer membrane protein [Acidobacteriota bacterium]